MAAIPIAASNGVSAYGASQTFYQPLAMTGYLGSTTESVRQLRWRSGGTLSLLTINILTNDRGTSTFNTRKAAANASQTISITASTTGYFSDISNTDTVGTGGEDWDTRFVSGAGGTTLHTRYWGCQFAATTNSRIRYCTNQPGFGFSGTTLAGPVNGTWPNAVAESTLKARFWCDGTIRNGSFTVSGNNRNANTTGTVRINEADSAVVVTITASTSGVFEDTSNTATVTSGDYVGWRWVTAGTTGGFTFLNSGFDFETTNGQSVWVVSAVTAYSPGTTVYANIAGEQSQGATETDFQFRAQLAATFANMNVGVSNYVNTGTSTVTLRVNAADTALVVSLSGTGRFDNTTDTVTVSNTTDALAYKVITSGSTGALNISNIAVNWNGTGSAPLGQPMMRRWGGSFWPTGAQRKGKGW